MFLFFYTPAFAPIFQLDEKKGVIHLDSASIYT